MTMLAERKTSQPRAHLAPSSNVSRRLVQRIRAEFLEMPGLRLTLHQAAKVFGIDAARVEPLLEELRQEGFLARDSRGAFRRCDAGYDRAPSRQRTGDLLDTIAIEVPCVVCHESYRVSLRKIQLSQLMMDDGCNVRHFADCPPAALSHLIDPAVVKAFEEAVRRIEAAVDGVGGHVVQAKR